MKIHLLLFLFLLMFCNCGSQSNKAEHPFKVITNTLEKQTARVGYVDDNDFKHRPYHIIGEDTVCMIADASISFLDSLTKQVLDRKGNSNQTPAFMTDAKIELRLNRIFLKAHKTFVAGLRYQKDNKSTIDSILHTEIEHTRHQGWVSGEFKGVPYFVTVTSLNKFKIDISRAANLTLSDMETHYRMIRSTIDVK